MLTWFYATLYSRQHELDGFIPREAIENLPKPANKIAYAEKLAGPKVGLFEPHEGGWFILKYEEWNETKAEISERRKAAAEASKRWRGKGHHASRETSVMHDATITSDSHQGLVPVSPSVSSSLPERVQGEGDADPRPASGRLPEGVVRFERDFWTAAYERAVDAVKGGERWTFPQKAFSALRAVVETHCRGEDRRNIAGWIETDVAAFVRALLDSGADEKFYSLYGPDGLLKWHNEGRPGIRRVTSCEPEDIDTPLPPPPMDAEANKAAGDELLAALARMG
jgi:hypothetical protein